MSAKFAVYLKMTDDASAILTNLVIPNKAQLEFKSA